MSEPAALRGPALRRAQEDIDQETAISISETVYARIGVLSAASIRNLLRESIFNALQEVRKTHR